MVKTRDSICSAVKYRPVSLGGSPASVRVRGSRSRNSLYRLCGVRRFSHCRLPEIVRSINTTSQPWHVQPPGRRCMYCLIMASAPLLASSSAAPLHQQLLGFGGASFAPVSDGSGRVTLGIVGAPAAVSSAGCCSCCCGYGYGTGGTCPGKPGGYICGTCPGTGWYG